MKLVGEMLLGATCMMKIQFYFRLSIIFIMIFAKLKCLSEFFFFKYCRLQYFKILFT